MAKLIDMVGAGTPVSINISGTDGAGNKFSVIRQLTLAELGVENTAQAAPEYPERELMTILLRKDIDGAEKNRLQDNLKNAWQKATEAYKTGGGTSVQNKIAAAVVSLCKKENGIVEKDAPGKWVLTAGSLTVTPIERNGQVVVQVSGAPTWG